ncbi:MAG: hypothetical protein PVG99_14190 [Desulfobacteraceae bacterium]
MMNMNQSPLYGKNDDPSSEPKANAPELPARSVSGMAPKYPKYRDPLIKLGVIFLLIVVFGGGYFLVKGTEWSLGRLKQDPVGFLTKLIWRDGASEACESFIKENQNLFRHLGERVTLTPIRREISIFNRAKTARVVFRAEGSADTEKLLFLLKKRRGEWQIVSVKSKTRRGEYRKLYPQPESKANTI